MYFDNEHIGYITLLVKTSIGGLGFRDKDLGLAQTPRYVFLLFNILDVLLLLLKSASRKLF
jgi:hypothetical protein